MNFMLGFSTRARSILPAPEMNDTNQLSFCYRGPKTKKIAPCFWAHVDASYRGPLIGPGFDTCVSDIPIHPLNYPEELAAIR